MQQRKYFMRTFLALALFSMCYTVTSLYILYSQNRAVLPAFLYAKGSEADHFTCSHPKKGNFLDLIDAGLKPENSIFFHETTCLWYLRPREACSVESAARIHSKRTVYVVFSNSLTENDCVTGILAELASMPNVRFYRMDLNTYTQDTPLEKIPMPRLIKLGRWTDRKTRELFKILTLYKFGGIVMELDMMVVGDLGSLGASAWASREGESFASSAIGVARGLTGKYYSQHFYKALKRELAYDLGASMESALKAALQSLCNTTDVEEMTQERCKGFKIYSSEFFSPGNRWADLKATANTTGYLGYYLWDESNGNHTMPMDSLYASLAERHCPRIFRKFMYSVGNNETINV